MHTRLSTTSERSVAHLISPDESPALPTACHAQVLKRGGIQQASIANEYQSLESSTGQLKPARLAQLLGDHLGIIRVGFARQVGALQAQDTGAMRRSQAGDGLRDKVTIDDEITPDIV